MVAMLYTYGAFCKQNKMREIEWKHFYPTFLPGQRLKKQTLTFEKETPNHTIFTLKVLQQVKYRLHSKAMGACLGDYDLNQRTSRASRSRLAPHCQQRMHNRHTKLL